jgi:hypothetical protein
MQMAVSTASRVYDNDVEDLYATQFISSKQLYILYTAKNFWVRVTHKLNCGKIKRVPNIPEDI